MVQVLRKLQKQAAVLAGSLKRTSKLLAIAVDKQQQCPGPSSDAAAASWDAVCKCLAEELPAHLQELGQSLVASLPQRLCCNHPGCASLGKVSEAVAAAIACPRCGAAYCSKACYQGHWKQHKAACKLAAVPACKEADS
jgi:hypothetical protein